MKKILLSSALLLFAMVSFAQRPGKEKIKAQKTAFITNELNLSSEEAAQFWPVYNNFETKERALRKNFGKPNKGMPTTDQEANDIILKQFELKTKMMDLEKQKLAALREVISPVQIVKLYKAEKAFKKKVLRAIRNKRKGGKGGRR